MIRSALPADTVSDHYGLGDDKLTFRKTLREACGGLQVTP